VYEVGYKNNVILNEVKNRSATFVDAATTQLLQLSTLNA